MAELIFFLLAIVALIAVLILRRSASPLALWASGWAIFAAMAVFIRSATESAWAPQASPLLSPLLPAFLLAGARAYADRPPLTWLLPAAFGIGVLRLALHQMGFQEGSHAIAILVEPTLTLTAAWLILRSVSDLTPRITKQLLAAARFVIAALDAITGIAVATGNGTSAALGPTWGIALLITLGIQVSASGQRARKLRGQLELESDGARRALDESERRFEVLSEHVSDVISEVDSQGDFSYLSPSLTHVLGWNPEDLLGSSAVELVHPEDRAEAATHMMQALESSSAGALTYRSPHSDGHGAGWNRTSAALLGAMGRLASSHYLAT